MSKLSTLARWIVDRGIDNINPSMLSDDFKKDVLTESGMLFFKEGKIRDAVKALRLAGNSARLVELGDEFMKQNRSEKAALFFIPSGDKDRIEKAAALCAKEGHFELAFEAYSAAGNMEMASFIRENFL